MSDVRWLGIPPAQHPGFLLEPRPLASSGDAAGSACARPARPGAHAFLRLSGAAPQAAPAWAGEVGNEAGMRWQVAEQTCRARTRLLAAASHDLRQPLQAIGLWVELLREKVEGAELRGILGKIQQTAGAAERVLNALLDITRLDLGVVGVNVIDFAVADLLAHIASTFAPMARDHRLVLRVHPTNAIGRSDPVLLERILFNFASNAIRYSAHGGVLVGCRRRLNALSCEVWDTGPGIAQADLERIFEEFNQLAPEGAPRSLGALGLGLSIAQRTAGLLGHPIEVSSCLGRGSCFRVDIPWGTQPPQALAAPGADAATSVLGGAFVVVVEDEREQREAAELLLRNWGCHVVAAASAAQAIEQLGGHLRLPNVLLVDYRLQHHETGAAAIQAIRAALGDDTPALIITGECTAAAGACLRKLGAAVLPKPVHPETLRQHLAAAIVSRTSRLV